MNWKHIPHQFVLAFAFSIISIGIAVGVIQSTITTLGQAIDTIGYATMELQGVRYLSRTTSVLHRLLDYRTDLLIARTSAGDRRKTTTSASIAEISDRPSATSSLDEAIAGPLQALKKTWLRKASHATLFAADLSAVVATIQPLLAGVSGASGISNDPSIDGINFGDAIIRFPLSLAYGTEAASIAAANSAIGTKSFADRIRAAQLLAKARMAIDVGLQDAKDEMSANPDAGAALTREASVNVHDFKAIDDRIMGDYVRSDLQRRPVTDHVLSAQSGIFAWSSFAIIETLRNDLLATLNTRIEQARRQRRQLLLSAIGEVSLEFVVILMLAWISTVSYRNQRKRMAAERLALDSQRTELQAQLTQAKAQPELLGAKAQFRAVFDRAPIGMIIVDRMGRILDVNETAAEMVDSGETSIRASSVIADHAEAIERVFAGEIHVYSDEREYRDHKEHPRWLDASISPVNDEAGQTLFVILMLRDITERKVMETRLVFDAGHDALTGLPNRTNFVALLRRAFDDRQNSASGDVFSVVFIDFNDFKTINDSFGHHAGDKFLVDGAARLRSSVRSSDIVARIGGDEFALLLRGTDRLEIEKNVTRLQAVISLPVDIEGQLVATSASFGIAQAEPRYTLASEIIRDADTAMYHAKAEGGRKFVVFDAGMRERVVRRMQLSIDLVHALEHDELELFYQPIVDLEDGRIAGCEALVRWLRADDSLISPTEFLPLAEENGSIVEIGRWVTMTACRQILAWNLLRQRGLIPSVHERFVMHINLAVPEVHHVDLLANLQDTLMETNVAHDQIILEITEGIVLKNTEHSRTTLDALTAAGFRLCIDDFGTGYSSLRYLNDLPLHSFKIDRAFVSSGSDGLANQSIIEMLMALSRSLSLGVVAEGIETPRQWEQLRELGCRYGQGYLFARPLDANALTEMLKRDVPLGRAQPVIERAFEPMPS